MLWVIHDLTHAARALRAHPAFTTVVLFTLSLGIGGATAIFSVVHAVLLRPLPYHDESRIVMVWETEPAEGVEKKVGTPGNFQDWRSATTIDHLSAISQYDATMTGRGEPRRLDGRRISASLFAALGVKPLVGRGFVPDDEIEGSNVVLLSHHLWQRIFGGNPAVVGERIVLNDEARTIVGVMDPRFRLPRGRDDFWIPMTFTAWERQARGSHWLMAIGRLKPGISIMEAQADMDVIARRLAADYPRFNAREGLLVEPIREEMAAGLGPPLGMLLGAVLMVMLIATINVANLILARTSAQAREMAVRLALGAGRGRLIRQLLTESLLIGVLGSVGGCALAWAALQIVGVLLPQRIAEAGDITINSSMLMFGIGLGAISGVAFGLLPAGRMSRPCSAGSLSDASRMPTSLHAGRMSRALVAAELALAVVLVVGAGLLIRSFARLTDVPTGFRSDSVLTFRIELPRSRYPDPAKWSPMLDDLFARLGALPGVVAAGGISWLPLTTEGGSNALFVEGQPLPGPGEGPYVMYRLVTPGYFGALEIPLLAGRGFDVTDTASSPRTVVINETMAKRYWPAQSPLGRRVTFARTPRLEDWMTVIGVVGDTRQGSLRAPIDIEMFAAHTQEANWFPPSEVAVRTASDPLALAAAVREQVRAVDPLMPVSEVRTLDDVVWTSVTPARFNTALIVAFGGVALALAAVGVYGLLSLSVSARTREIGVRTALGARPAEISWMVVREGLTLGGVGLAAGIPAAVAFARLLRALLYETAPTDAATFIAVPALLLTVALAACYLPARRAARLDPVAAMRD